MSQEKNVPEPIVLTLTEDEFGFLYSVTWFVNGDDLLDRHPGYEGALEKLERIWKALPADTRLEIDAREEEAMTEPAARQPLSAAERAESLQRIAGYDQATADIQKKIADIEQREADLLSGKTDPEDTP